MHTTRSAGRDLGNAPEDGHRSHTLPFRKKNESADDQLEIVTTHADALKACDNLLLTRLAIGILCRTVV